MFECGKCGQKHNEVAVARQCYGLLPTYQPVRSVYVEEKMTDAQQAFLLRLGARRHQMIDAHNERITKKAASDLIDAIQKGKIVTTHTEDKRLGLLTAMMAPVESGYYAVQADDSDPMVFIRVSRPKTGRMKGTVKVQTQHGPSLRTDAVWWTTRNTWSIYHRDIIDGLLLLVTDRARAGIRYAQHLGRCMRCNLELTDERSRHYGIGPDCEKIWPHIIERVDELEEANAEQ